jgi:esterase/lipase superfamily enzyme
MTEQSTGGVIREALARTWPDLPNLIDAADWPLFEAAVLGHLSEQAFAEAALAEALNDDAKAIASDALDVANDRLVDVLAPYPGALERFHECEEAALRQRGSRGGESHPSGTVEYRGYLEIPVLYATTRKPLNSPDGHSGERSDPGENFFGQIMANLPLTHVIGKLRMPRRWRLDFKPEAEPGLRNLRRMNADDFVVAARAAIQALGTTAEEAVDTAVAEPRDVLVFIHGYNVGFNNAALRTAQLAYDLGFPGLPMLYSWPSAADVKAYAADKEAARFSAYHLMQFLRMLLNQVGPRQIHVIAHSMGNETLIGALKGLSLEEGRQLGHVVFAAPDFDLQTLAEQQESLAKKALSYTLYASSKDVALRASAFLANRARAGQASAHVVVAGHIDTVDASRLAKTDMLGHSGFATDRAILTDMRDLFLFGRPPSQRAGIRSATNWSGTPYWIFP